MKAKKEPEGDFKKILKNLLADKKRGEEGKEELEPKEQFYARVEKLQNLALEEEVIRIKTALVESETQNQLLLQQLEKAKPLYAKLTEESTELQQKVLLLEDELHQREKIRGQHENQQQVWQEKWQLEKGHFEKKYAKLQQQMNEVAEERELLQENYEKLEKAFKQNQRHLREESEAHFADMRLLQEKLAASEQQLRQTDLAKVHEEYEKRMTEVRAEKERLIQELAHLKQSALMAFENKEKLFQEKMQEGHYALQSWKEKCEQLEIEKTHFKQESQNQQEHNLNLERQLKEISAKWEENEVEIHKAQVHLAKKVKESALLQDVAEKQKEQLLETQKLWSKENERRIMLEKNVDQFLEKEEQITSYAKQCNEDAERMITELDHRCRQWQQEYDKQLVKIGELEKYREAYEKLVTTLKDI